MNEELCRGCTICVEFCPVTVPDPFNFGLSQSKAIHIYFSQAVPLIAYIDENCLYLKERKCRICESVCEHKAVDFSQREREIELTVGAVVIAAGFEVFDPSRRKIYGYNRYPDVVTSMEFERILCSTGPYDGKILRPSDKREPRRIAWLQCVGSRRVTEGDRPYCSSVCCTYTQKQVILTKLHSPETECVVFHNDIRAYGKDFERFYKRAAQNHDVRFVRSYATLVGRNPENGSLILRYKDPENGVREEEFDMVVLCVGVEPPSGGEMLAQVFGFKLGEDGFCYTLPEEPLETTREGVFVCGGFTGPCDIPESVFGAGGAAAKCGQLLSYRRGKLLRKKTYPPERDLKDEPPRIGVFVCHCGANIGRIVDVPSVVRYASSLPGVIHAQEQLFSCAANSIQEIVEAIKEKRLNRVVVAACSPLTLENLFRETLREAGINQYYLDMANIREHNSWVHMREPDYATQKAKDLVRMSVARAYHLEPLQEIELSVRKEVLILGAGIAGMVCAFSIAEQGHRVYIVEKEEEVGGVARRIHHTLDGLNVQEYLTKLIRKVKRHPLISLFTKATLRELTGYVGNFKTVIETEGRRVELNHGAVVVATGAAEYRPKEYLYGLHKSVMTQLELEEHLATDDSILDSVEDVVMIQCVGCRNEERGYCARICCTHAIKNALTIKEKRPQIDVYILFRDMRTYGFYEKFYRAAAEKGVLFIRYEPNNPPRVESLTDDEVEVTVFDPVVARNLRIKAGILALSAAVVPQEGNEKIAQLLKVPLTSDGFFKEAHVKLRPVDFGTDGVFLCGMAQYPKHISEVIKQAYGAAGRVLTLLSQDVVTVSGAVCVVDEKVCIGCGACVDVCAYGAVQIQTHKKKRKAVVNPVLCKGDGLCNAVCPTGAITLKHYKDSQINSQIDAVFSALRKEVTASKSD